MAINDYVFADQLMVYLKEKGVSFDEEGFPLPCESSYVSYRLLQGYASTKMPCRIIAWDIHSNRQIGLFGPSLFFRYYDLC